MHFINIRSDIKITERILEVKCDCSHACRLVPSDDTEKPHVECYCPEGFHLADDEKTCLVDEGVEKEYTVVQVITEPDYDDNLTSPVPLSKR